MTGMTPERLAFIRDRWAMDPEAARRYSSDVMDVHELLAEVDRLTADVQWWKDRDECERANWQAVVDRLEARVAELELTAGVGP